MIPFPKIIKTGGFEKFVITGGEISAAEAGTPTTKLFDTDGNLKWKRDELRKVNSVSGNAAGYYITGKSVILSGENAISRFDWNGNLVSEWGASQSIGQCLSVDYVSGDVFTGDNSSAVRKWDDEGNLIWTVINSTQVNGVKYDGTYVYFVDEDGYVTKLTATGGVVWTQDSGEVLYSVDYDSSGYVYTGGQTNIKKWSSTGSNIWSVNPSSTSNTISVDSSGYVYCGGFDGNLRKYSPTGSFIWSQSHGAIIRGSSVDSFDNIYIVGNMANVAPNDISIRKYNSSGTLLWSKTHNQGLWSVDIN